MQIHKDQKGVALITALMLTLISLTIIMALFYLLARNVEVSGSHKRYKTALEAAYGSVEIGFDEVIPRVFEGKTFSLIDTELGGLGLSAGPVPTCLDIKLRSDTAMWPSACDNTMDAKTGFDMSFNLQSANTTAGSYRIYAKIVDTEVGNTDISGRNLLGAGVVENQGLTPTHRPYRYRVEIRAESAGGTPERAILSAVYGY